MRQRLRAALGLGDAVAEVAEHLGGAAADQFLVVHDQESRGCGSGG